MSGLLEPGYVDFALGFIRTGDVDEYFVNFAASITTPPFTLDNLTDLAIDLDASTELRAVMSNQQRFNRLRARVGTDGDPIVYEWPMGSFGTSTADVAPPNVCALWRKNTNLGGRRNRGRLYWPSVPEATIDPVGVMTAAQRGAQQTAAGFLRGRLESEFYNTDGMVLLHSTPPVTPTPVTSLNVDSLIATQRRRLRR